MLNLLPTHPLLVKIIKVMSCILIAGALGLVIGKLNGLIPVHSPLEKVSWVATVALLFHGLEGLAAAILAYRLKENPFKAALYTFWTGIAGITEILQRLENNHQATTL